MIETGENGWCMRRCLLNSCFMTVRELDEWMSEMLEHAESTHDSETVIILFRWGLVRGHTKIGPVRQVKVTCHSKQFGIEIQVKSMKNDGSLSWIVLSGGMNNFVEEIWQEKGESSYHEEMVTGSDTGTPVATKQRGRSSPRSYLVSKMFVPI